MSNRSGNNSPISSQNSPSFLRTSTHSSDEKPDNVENLLLSTSNDANLVHPKNQDHLSFSTAISNKLTAITND